MTGSCLCGKVRYEAEGELTAMHNCHCSRCRKHSGAAFVTDGFVAASRFRWLSGEDADRERRLLLERLRAAVPELRLVVEGVQDGRGVPLTAAAVDPDRDGPPVSEPPRRIMAGAASNAPVGRQAAIEEQSLTEGNLLGGLRIVGRYRRVSRVGGGADLVNGFGPSERACFGNLRGLERGLRGRSENQRRRDHHEHEGAAPTLQHPGR